MKFISPKEESPLLSCTGNHLLKNPTFMRTGLIRWRRVVVALFLSSVCVEAGERVIPTQPLLAAPVPFAAAARVEAVQTAKPEWVGSAIVAGNKQFLMSQDGVVSYFVEGRAIGKFVLPFSVTDKRTGKSEWLSTDVNHPKGFFDLSQSGIIGQEGELGYRKTLVLAGNFVECVTTLRLQPDGQILLTYRWQPYNSTDLELVPRTAMFVVPSLLARGEFFEMNGARKMLSEGGEAQLWNSPDFTSLSIFPNRPEQSLVINATPLTADARVDSRTDSVMFRFANRPGKNELSILIDIRKGLAAKSSSKTLAGIDFKKIDALILPDFKVHRNLIQNSSFEQGLDCYWGTNATRTYQGPGIWDKRAYLIDPVNPMFGRQSLQILTGTRDAEDYRFIGYPFKTFPVPLGTGKYTFSFYARSEDGEDSRISVWFPNVSWLGSRKASLPIGWENFKKTGAQRVFNLTNEWRRYHFTFEVPESMPVVASLGADSNSGTSFVWVDGLQLEAGESPSPYAPRQVEAQLLTSKADNFLGLDDPIEARLDITAATNADGIVTVSVKDFFDKVWFKESVPFRCDETGRSTVPLPLNGKLPRGIFVVQAEYRMADGLETYSTHRLAIMDSLTNEHRLKTLFSDNYQDDDAVRFNFRDMLDRYRKVGIGGKNHTFLWDKEIWEEYSKYGITSTDSVMYSVLAPFTGITSNITGFAMKRNPDMYAFTRLPENDPQFLIRDFKLDAGGEVTDAYLDKLREVTATLAKENPWIPMWAFGVEMFAKFPVEWWSKDGSAENAYLAYAKILKAFYQGVKEGNPNALVYQDTPSNMSPERGIAETGALLNEVNKLGGVKFDMIGIHTYRKSPEAPDFDSDAQTFFEVLSKNGYGDTPVFWPEGMHYGPYTIPQWGIESASWLPPACWSYGTLTYDMGWAEKISAAWQARSWLVALKYQDRVKSLMSGSFKNNFEMDLNLTPFASQKIPNTLGKLFGNAYFKKDIRFAPYIRCYVFEDDQKRPVAVVWCHHPKVDAGTLAGPTVTAGLAATQIFDLMECERSFSPDANGDLSFQVSSFPLFIRGKPGTLDALVHALENATLESSEGITPLLLTGKPTTPDQVTVTARNYLSRTFNGKFESNGQNLSVEIPASGAKTFLVNAPSRLEFDKIVEEKIPITVKSGAKAFAADVSFRGFLSHKLNAPIKVDGNIGDWSGIEPIPFTNRLLRNKNLKSVSALDFSGWLKTAWTPQGLYLSVKIVDDRFAVKSFARLADRWNNDCLQIYFDSFCDARAKQQQGFDENDYAYVIHVSSDGSKSEVYRGRTPDPQLGLATQAPQDNTIAADIPSAFKLTSDGYVYEVFFPAKYLLPIRLAKGNAIGFNLMVNDRDDIDFDAKSSLTLTPDGTDGYNRPDIWPAMLLWE